MRYVLIALMLAGCTTASKVATNQMERDITVYGPACEKLGFQKDTDAWRDCIIRRAAS